MRTKADRMKAFKNIAGGMVSDGMYWRMLQDDFFEAPASATHHGNYPGGLYDHSEMVALTLAAGIERRKGMSDYEFIIKIQNLLISKEACVIDTGSYRDVNAVIIPRLEKK